ncbi:MAG: alpha-E domain-containing protein, partial [Verrucomicrobiales bacterium]
NSQESERLLASDPSGYYEAIRRSTFSFHGVAAATTLRGEQWEFMDLGRHLERADKTTRFLDITTFLEGGDDDWVINADEHWMGILRSCGGVGPFRAKYRGRFSPQNITDFLVFSSDFPRSVKFCMNRVDASLHAISGSPRGTFVNDAEKESGKMLSALSYGSCAEVMEGGLHTYLDGLQVQLNTIADAIFKAYILLPEEINERPSIPAAAISSVVKWQMEQQQQ